MALLWAWLAAASGVLAAATQTVLGKADGPAGKPAMQIDATGQVRSVQNSRRLMRQEVRRHTQEAPEQNNCLGSFGKPLIRFQAIVSISYGQMNKYYQFDNVVDLLWLYDKYDQFDNVVDLLWIHDKYYQFDNLVDLLWMYDKYYQFDNVVDLLWMDE